MGVGYNELFGWSFLQVMHAAAVDINRRFIPKLKQLLLVLVI